MGDLDKRGVASLPRFLFLVLFLFLFLFLVLCLFLFLLLPLQLVSIAEDTSDRAEALAEVSSTMLTNCRATAFVSNFNS